MGTEERKGTIEETLSRMLREQKLEADRHLRLSISDR